MRFETVRCYFRRLDATSAVSRVAYLLLEREAKWSKYLQDEKGQGLLLLQCILAKNKGWTQTCGEVAETAHDIDAAKEDEFGKKNIVVPLSSQFLVSLQGFLLPSTTFSTD
jgi:hypothetical protein